VATLEKVITRRSFVLLSAAACCGQAEDLSLPVTRTKTHLALVPVTVGETRLNFIVDTGAGSSMIALEALKRLRPDDYELRGAVSQEFSGGKVEAQRVALRSVAIATAPGVAIDVNAIAMSPLKEMFGADVDGVLGMEILSRYALRLDFRTQRIDLLPPETSAGDDAIPFEFNEHREILFPAQLDGKPVTALLDSGAGQTCVNWNAARLSGVDPNTRGVTEKSTAVGGDRNVLTIHQYRFAGMQIGALHWVHPVLLIADVPAFTTLGLATSPGAIVGMNMLDNRVTTISFTERRLTIR